MQRLIAGQQIEIADLSKQLADALTALTPQPPPDNLVAHGLDLEPTRQNADFWYKAGHSEEAKVSGESVICMAQAVFAWKNAAYAKAEDVMKLEKQLAQALAACAAKDEALGFVDKRLISTDLSGVIRKALAIQPDDTALREWGAKLLEQEAKLWDGHDDSYVARQIRANAEDFSLRRMETMKYIQSQIISEQNIRITQLEDEIKGWKIDQKENMKVAFDLQAEVNQLRAALVEARANLYDMCDAAIVYRIEAALTRCKEALNTK